MKEVGTYSVQGFAIGSHSRLKDFALLIAGKTGWDIRADLFVMIDKQGARVQTVFW